MQRKLDSNVLVYDADLSPGLIYMDNRSFWEFHIFLE